MITYWLTLIRLKTWRIEPILTVSLNGIRVLIKSLQMKSYRITLSWEIQIYENWEQIIRKVRVLDHLSKINCHFSVLLKLLMADSEGIKSGLFRRTCWARETRLKTWVKNLRKSAFNGFLTMKSSGCKCMSVTEWSIIRVRVWKFVPSNDFAQNYLNN